MLTIGGALQVRSNTAQELQQLRDARRKMSAGIGAARITNAKAVVDQGPQGDLTEYHTSRFSNAVQQLLVDHHFPHLKWRRNRTAVYDARYLRRKVAAGCALLGGLFSIAQNEILIRGTSPSDPIMVLLKFLNTIASITMVRTLSLLTSTLGAS